MNNHIKFTIFALPIVVAFGLWYGGYFRTPVVPTNNPSPTPSVQPPPTTPPVQPPPVTPPPVATPPPPSSSATPKEIISGNTSKKQVIFTFDGGSGSHSGEEILDVLEKHNVKGTFFLTGKFAELYPDLTKKFAAEGHEIYNHTYSHPYLTQISDQQIVEEFTKTDKIISDLTGKTTKPFFRPPYGSRNANVLKIAGQQGYQSVYWTTDALDWKPGITESEVKKKIMDNLKPGALYLMHIGDDITGNILDEVFTDIKAQGYTIVSLTEGIK